VTDSDRLVCQLVHPGFRLLGAPVFRLSEGAQVPSMVVRFDDHDAVLPLHSVVKEFGIDPNSADGRMLVLIEQALDFVVAVRVGDTLPPEVNGGEASWTPSPTDRVLAASRVRYALVRSLANDGGRPVPQGCDLAPGWEHDPANRTLLLQAIDSAAAVFRCGEAREVTQRLDTIGEEVAYIETLRRGLTRGMAGFREKLLSVHTEHVPTALREPLDRVQHLARRGATEISGRFLLVDARLTDMLAVLRDVSSAVAWLRKQRDWLVRTRHAWEPVFAGWAAVTNNNDDAFWHALERTYAFLAPRFMPFQEWAALDPWRKDSHARMQIW
jgi:hypothetical protein